MCELFGVSSKMPTGIMPSFASFAQRGGNSGPHRDGWGITFYEGSKGCRTFKDTCPSCCSEVSSFVQRYPINSPLIIAHIRQANRGEVNTENTHPFSRELWGRCWTFAHNGQLSGDLVLNVGEFIPLGQTDSEQAFCYLLNEMKREFTHPPQSNERLFDFIANKAKFLNSHGVFNMLLSDGEHLMAFCGSKLAWVHRKPPFTSIEYLEEQGNYDLAKVYSEQDRLTLVATEPLTDEDWQKLQVNQYALFQSGHCISCNQDEV